MTSVHGFTEEKRAATQRYRRRSGILVLSTAPHNKGYNVTFMLMSPFFWGVVLSLVALISFTATAKGAAEFPPEFRTIDGTGNNTVDPAFGSAGIPLLRLVATDYGDGIESPAGADKVSAREISNACVAQVGSILNAKNMSSFVWQWGQFLDHDIDLTGGADPAEPFDISVPMGDPFFDPLGTGTQTIPLNRSIYTYDNVGVRQQINQITSFIDASNVYGSDIARATELRTLDGTGRLKTSPGDLLPFNVNGFPNAPTGDPSFFLAGDVRANEQVALTAMHTLFVREHNRWAFVFRFAFPTLSGDDVYELARAMVGAQMQAITYNEFLPVLLGENALEPYTGYKPLVNPGIANVFSTSAYRFGHSMLPSVLLRLQRNGQPISAGNLPLAEAFFNPDEIIDSNIDPLLRGLYSQTAEEVDMSLVDAISNFLFGPPGSGGFDLASLNIQRGRDHGLPGHNQVRTDFGLPPAVTFAEINPDPQVQAKLESVFDTVDDVNFWMGGLAEAHFGDAAVGETNFTVLKDQFERLRDGDRLWYEIALPDYMIRWVEHATLKKTIQRNTSIRGEIKKTVFITGTGAKIAADLPNRPEIDGSQNASATLKVKRVDDALEQEEMLRLLVTLDGAQMVNGYGFAFQYDAFKYEFIEASEVANHLRSTGSYQPSLFSASTKTPGQVAVGTLDMDVEPTKWEGKLVEFLFKTMGTPLSTDFQIVEGMLVDSEGNIEVVQNVEIGDLSPTSSSFALAQNGPNPFNSSTTIGYKLPESAFVKLAVYNLLGQEIRSLVDESLTAGNYSVSWDGRDDQGRYMASGIYLYRMQAGNFSQTRRIVFVK